jgi:hypothetical protein
MKESVWHKKWLKNHPNASVQEYSNAVKKRTILTTLLAYITGTVAFIAVVYFAFLLEKL